ncbi:MAG: glycosyltransferase [Candidatus Heimdallarchaeota archaeon]
MDQIGQRYRIGYLCTPIEFGGSEKVNLNFLRNVSRVRFDINPILLIRPWEKDSFFIRQLNEAKYRAHKIPVAKKLRSVGRDYLRIVRCFKELYRFLSNNKIQLLHTHGYFADIIGVPVARMLRIPHISTCHGFISNDRNLVLYNKLDRMVLRFSDKIIAVSEQIKDDLERSGIRRKKITVIQNAVQATHKTEQYAENRRKKRLFLAINDEEFAVGYVGRLSEEKGVQYLIDAGRILIETGEVFKILIIGDGPQREELEGIVKQKGLKRAIIFTGFQTDVEKWMPCLDIFVLSSLTEGTPMALLEAMSFGIPVVASDVGGIPNVIKNGENGILVDPADSKAIAENLKILFHNPSLRKSMAKEAVGVIEKKHNIDDWCREIESQYNHLVHKKSKKVIDRKKCKGL